MIFWSILSVSVIRTFVSILLTWFRFLFPSIFHSIHIILKLVRNIFWWFFISIVVQDLVVGGSHVLMSNSEVHSWGPIMLNNFLLNLSIRVVCNENNSLILCLRSTSITSMRLKSLNRISVSSFKSYLGGQLWMFIVGDFLRSIYYSWIVTLIFHLESPWCLSRIW